MEKRSAERVRQKKPSGSRKRAEGALRPAFVGPSVMLADHDPVFRDLVRRLLGSSVLLVGEAHDGERALALFRKRRPEVVLMDLDLCGPDGLETTRQIKAEGPEAKVILLTGHEEEAYLEATGKSGADVLLPKRSARLHLLSLIYDLARGVLPWGEPYRRPDRDRGGA